MDEGTTKFSLQIRAAMFKIHLSKATSHTMSHTA